MAGEKRALYWGCWDRVGHYMHNPNGTTVWHPKRDVPGFPWEDHHLGTFPAGAPRGIVVFEKADEPCTVIPVARN